MSVSKEESGATTTPDLGLLEEDDEFEEFPAEDWDSKEEDQEDINVWEDNWDDDTVEDDFSVQLNRFSRKRTYPRSPPLRSPEPVAKKVCSREVPPCLVPAAALSPASNGKARASRNGARGISSSSGIIIGNNENSCVTDAAAVTTATSNENQADMEGLDEDESHTAASGRGGRRSGRGRATARTTTSSSRTAAAESSPAPSPSRSTRSSARLRSSRK